MFYVYLLKSRKDRRFYVGYSADLKLRIKEHNEGEVEATRHRRPLDLVYYESYKVKKAAQERERKLKHFGAAYYELLKRI
ncbi:MAG: GIY-YIG nuclease family protein [Candidatus Moranbacteria bacterium]|nr:GIY-YIG nuclease family protein [Candidatus Moranbacteria bacterium]